MGKKNITFSDIAKYTGFSKTTISRYFNNPDSLTLENQQIIATALEKLNYKENKVARILANGTLSDISFSYSPEMTTNQPNENIYRNFLHTKSKA